MTSSIWHFFCRFTNSHPTPACVSFSFCPSYPASLVDCLFTLGTCFSWPLTPPPAVASALVILFVRVMYSMKNWGKKRIHAHTHTRAILFIPLWQKEEGWRLKVSSTLFSCFSSLNFSFGPNVLLRHCCPKSQKWTVCLIAVQIIRPHSAFDFQSGNRHLRVFSWSCCLAVNDVEV